MELRDALAQISEIRGKMAQAETFRGYRSVTVGFSGMLAFVGAGIQMVWIPVPAQQFAAYLTVWVSLAALSVVVTGCEMYLRVRRSESELSLELTRFAVLQFVPCILVGAMLTYVMTLYARDGLWMLPGLWAMIFSLGVFASCRLLPKGSVWLGVYYLASGAVCLALAQGVWAFSPWAMIGTFGVGQLVTALLLYQTLEKSA